MLGQRLEGEIEVIGQAVHATGADYLEVNLVSEDGQTLHIFPGQLKEVGNPELVAGNRYRIAFEPFVNNRWIELKIVALTPA